MMSRPQPRSNSGMPICQTTASCDDWAPIKTGRDELVVDECHHLSAASFELVARRSKAKYVLGLSATVARKDGHHPIIFMQCGPVRHRVDPRVQAQRRGIDHRVRIRQTEFRLEEVVGQRLSMPSVYAALANDTARNALIFDDVLTALDAGRWSHRAHRAARSPGLAATAVQSVRTQCCRPQGRHDASRPK
jgi:Type III restriction enzyme, res subunit